MRRYAALTVVTLLAFIAPFRIPAGAAQPFIDSGVPEP
jgi:hypothetical protein